VSCPGVEILGVEILELGAKHTFTQVSQVP